MMKDYYERLNPPPLQLTAIGNEPYEKMNTDPRWLRVGYIPRPKTRIGWFVYNMIHGFAMRYPFLEVVKFSLTTLVDIEQNDHEVSVTFEPAVICPDYNIAAVDGLDSAPVYPYSQYSLSDVSTSVATLGINDGYING